MFRVCQFLSFVFLFYSFNVKSEDIYIQPPAEHRAALVDLYNATDGGSWKDRGNWLNGEVCAGWAGVVCRYVLISDDGEDRTFQLTVTELRLSFNNLKGNIPSSLGNLNTLTGLDLSHNKLLTGSIPSSIANLSALSKLDVSESNLTGSIPNSLGSMSSLTRLYLQNNELTGEIPNTLGNMSALKRLWLFGNQLTGNIPSSLANLSNLNYLDLTNNKLTGEIPESLGSSSSIVLLRLGYNELTGEIPDSLGGLNTLSALHLFNNQLTGSIPSSLANLSYLVGLDLTNNGLTGEIPSSLGNLSALRSLRLDRNQLTGSIPSSLANLSALTELNLSYNKLIGEIPHTIFKFIDSNQIESSFYSNGELGAPLLNEFQLQYPWITNRLVNQLSSISFLGGRSCYPDTGVFVILHEGTDWLGYACGTETESCPVENTGPECLHGNPINARTGVKIESSTDYSASGPSPLKIKRGYSSSKDERAWQFNTVTQSLLVSGNYVKLRGRSKSNYLFYCSSSAPSSCSPRKLIGQSVTYYNYKLNKLLDGYQLTLPSGAIETYSTTGRLTSTASSQGNKLIYSYASNSITVADEFGQQITLTTNIDNLVTQAVTPIGTFTYGYDEFNRLTTVTQPDTTSIGYRYDEAGYSTVQYNNSSDQGQTETCSGDDYLTIEACKLLVKNLGLLTGKIDENGQRYTSWYYDNQQRAYKSEHGSGIDTTEIVFVSEQGELGTNELDEPITLQQIRDTISPLGLRTRTTFKEDGQRAEKIETFDVSNNLITIETYSYDSRGYEAEHTDVNGLITRYVHDSLGRERSRTEYAETEHARITTTQYSDNTTKPTRITNPETIVDISYVNHNLGLLVSSQRTTDRVTNEQRTTSFTYYANGQLKTTNGPRTNVNDITTHEYNAQGFRTKTTNALGHTTQVTAFNAYGSPLTLVDENNIETTLSYDLMGRVITIQRAGTTQGFNYDLNGTLLKSTLANGSNIYYEYDSAQRLIAMRDHFNNRIEYTLDAAGNKKKTEIKDTSGTLLQLQQQLYDEFSRLVSITNGTNNTTQLDYLANGNLNKSTDALTHQTNNNYDALQRLKEIHDPESGTTQFSYDNAGRTTAITDATGKATTYTYNGFGELTQQISPETGKTTYTYNKAGNLATETDARGITVSYEYDALNRLTHMRYPNTIENVNFNYDDTSNSNKGIGRLTSVTEASGNKHYTYNALGRLLTETYSIGSKNYLLTYQYNSVGQLTRITYPSGRTVNYTLNALGQINQISTRASGAGKTAKTLLSGAEYLPFGPVKSFTYGNGLVNSFTFDKNYRLKTHTLTGLKNQTLSYTDVGNITAIADASNSSNNRTFGYDKLSRLLSSSNGSAAGTIGNMAFSYDGIGNRLTKTDGPVNESYSYIENTHHLEKVIIDAAIAKPNLMSTFNDTRRMLSMGNTQYKYNYRQLRVSKSKTVTVGESNVTSGTHYHYGADGLLIGESTLNGTWLKEYVYFNGQLIAMVDYIGDVASEPYAVHNDHLGTPTQITSSTGVLVWSANYSPFGLATINNDVDGDTNTVELNIRFPGQYYDAESQLHYNWHRYYDPSIGRYITSDPLGLAAGMNTYGYVEGNPIKLTDPLGLMGGLGNIGRGGRGVLVGGSTSGALGQSDQVYSDRGTGRGTDRFDADRFDEGETCDDEDDECEKLNKNVQKAKKKVGKVGACRAGMSQFDLWIRRNAWFDLAKARAISDEKCWGGGDDGHQQAQASAWQHVGNCERLMK